MRLADADLRRPPARSSTGTRPLGAVLGTVQVPAHVIRLSDQLAGEFYTAAEESDFSDQVETFAIPSWAKRDGAPWLPNLAALGYCHADSGYRGRDEQFVATAAVDMHTDDEGLVLMVVLHNDGLTFRQGTVRHKPKAGDWFIFDDRLPHGVAEAPGRAAFLGWNIPIIPL
ncbi:TPA: hypothetical protein ACU967_006140 [Burkholderia contaminans]|uniref:hypothetical protein n=1 Tax=Burkholderia TaxID=32008 RepID=UPI000755A79A|nr:MULTISPECIES: hypothetical protein [Burkholderia]KVS29000.1 hypothetical protein WK34_10060 [Burkholderia vietnamiensis]MBM6430732.1 hypothetical protein [Burkholderia contaminans]MBR8015184.1 hypothetical protein [Burkholderia vietnamiensis]MCA7881032.1 hypothetical protein [Burkholderia contaminans]MCB4348988.1 hypothetical protein [Burkholderia vietnamiensis]